MNREIKKYDKVKIEWPGKLYSTYRLMAEKLQLRNFEYGHNNTVTKGAIGKVIAVENHHQTNKKIYGIKLDLSGRDIIMGYDGVSLYEPAILSMDESLFEL